MFSLRMTSLDLADVVFSISCNFFDLFLLSGSPAKKAIHKITNPVRTAAILFLFFNINAFNEKRLGKNPNLF